MSSDVKLAQALPPPPPGGQPPMSETPMPADPGMAAPPGQEAIAPPPEPQDERPLPEILEEIKKDIDALSMKLESGDMMLDGEEYEHFEPDSGAMPAPAPKMAAGPNDKKDPIFSPGESRFDAPKTDMGSASDYNKAEEAAERKRIEDAKLRQLAILAQMWGFEGPSELYIAYKNHYTLEPRPDIKALTEEQAEKIDSLLPNKMVVPERKHLRGLEDEIENFPPRLMDMPTDMPPMGPNDPKWVDSKKEKLFTDIEKAKKLGKNPYELLSPKQIEDALAETRADIGELGGKFKTKEISAADYAQAMKLLDHKLDQLELAKDKSLGEGADLPLPGTPMGPQEMVERDEPEAFELNKELDKSKEVEDKVQRSKPVSPRQTVVHDLRKKREQLIEEIRGLPTSAPPEAREKLMDKIRVIDQAIERESKPQPKVDLKKLDPDQNEIQNLSKKKLFLMEELRNMPPEAPVAERLNLRKQIESVERELAAKRPSLDKLNKPQAPVDKLTQKRVTPRKRNVVQEKILEMARDQAYGIGPKPDWEAAKKYVLDNVEMPLEDRKRNLALIEKYQGKAEATTEDLARRKWLDNWAMGRVKKEAPGAERMMQLMTDYAPGVITDEDLQDVPLESDPTMLDYKPNKDMKSTNPRKDIKRTPGAIRTRASETLKKLSDDYKRTFLEFKDLFNKPMAKVDYLSPKRVENELSSEFAEIAKMFPITDLSKVTDPALREETIKQNHQNGNRQVIERQQAVERFKKEYTNIAKLYEFMNTRDDNQRILGNYLPNGLLEKIPGAIKDPGSKKTLQTRTLADADPSRVDALSIDEMKDAIDMMEALKDKKIEPKDEALYTMKYNDPEKYKRLDPQFQRPKREDKPVDLEKETEKFVPWEDQLGEIRNWQERQELNEADKFQEDMGMPGEDFFDLIQNKSPAARDEGSDIDKAHEEAQEIDDMVDYLDQGSPESPKPLRKAPMPVVEKKPTADWSVGKPKVKPKKKSDLEKEAVDGSAKEYYHDYFGDYGDDMVEDRVAEIIDSIDDVAATYGLALPNDQVNKLVAMLSVVSDTFDEGLEKYAALDSDPESTQLVDKLVLNYLFKNNLLMADLTPDTKLAFIVSAVSAASPEVRERINKLAEGKMKSPAVKGQPDDAVKIDKLKDTADEDDNMLARPAHLHMEVESKKKDGQYLVMEISWDADDDAANRSEDGMKHAVRSFVKGLESTKEFLDYGFMGEMQFAEIDTQAGVATIRVRTNKSDAPMSVRQS